MVNVGHGDPVVSAAARDQFSAVSYVHPSAFTTEVSETYAARLAAIAPVPDASVYPVSGGSEAVETALKVARAYHLAMGASQRTVIIGRELSYHGNTRGALDVSGRVALRRPYLPWLGLAGRVPGVLEYRCPNPRHPDACAAWHAGALEAEIARIGPDRVAAFVAEVVGGAASGAAVPPDGYWEAITAVCRRHGVLVIADEVMSGFGRTGAWFAAEHFGLEPDILTLAKGASSGYWPLGLCLFRGDIARALEESGLVHGFTFSHHPVGAAVGLAVLERIDELGLVDAARTRGERLIARLREEIGDHPLVGDIRGIGLMLAVEIVSDRDTREPFPAAARMADRLASLARDERLLVYPSTGSAGSGLGDLVLVGPPLVIDEDAIDMLVASLSTALGHLS